jgi:hypothetical protein
MGIVVRQQRPGDEYIPTNRLLTEVTDERSWRGRTLGSDVGKRHALVS